MNKARSSMLWVKFWRYTFLSLLFFMVATLYIIASKSLGSRGIYQPIAAPQTIKLSHKEQHEENFSTYDAPSVPHYQDISVPTCGELCQKFNERGYHLTKDEVSDHYQVARVYLASFPKDFSRLNYSEKKQLFLKSLLPLILQTNEKVASERKKLLQIMDLKRAGVRLSFSHHKWLSEMALKYKLKKMCLNELCQRIDIIPASLALSQAITETGWGTSYAAKEKKSPFGFTVNNRVISFQSLRHSVEAYVLTLNSHPAYKNLRKIRSVMRKKNTPLCGLELAKGLKNYSTRGHAYISEVQQVIRNNRLKQFDSAHLTSSL